jgi:antitoxin (DNA-binding transcriptional repressor) of toxin-antitoxin stability system
MLEAKSSLSRLVAAVESGEAEAIVIARGGRPAAKLVPIDAAARIRLGVAKGRFRAPASIDADNEAIERLFSLGEAAPAVEDATSSL